MSSVTPRRLVKRLAGAISIGLMAPLALPCWLEARLIVGGEAIFHFCTHLIALLPGLPGVYLRRGFYRLTLDYCDLDSHMEFGAFCSHRHVTIERHVYVGPYAIIGASRLREHTLIGSRVSILSGGGLHRMDSRGHWSPTDLSLLEQMEIGPHVWIGEGAIVMAHVGPHTMIAAGSVVSAPVAEGVVVAGNPARFVRRLRPESVETERESA